MVLDTSAIIATITNEQDSSRFRAAMLGAESLLQRHRFWAGNAQVICPSGLIPGIHRRQAQTFSSNMPCA